MLDVEVSKRKRVRQSFRQSVSQLQDDTHTHTYVITPKWLIAVVIYLTFDDFAKSFSQPLFLFHLHSLSLCLSSSLAGIHFYWRRSLIYVEFIQRLSINGVTVFFDIVCMHACMHLCIYWVPLGFSRDLCSIRNCFSTFNIIILCFWYVFMTYLCIHMYLL